MKREQYVCLVCGFNMIGFHPDRCPFCGAAKKHFITAEECSTRYKVVATTVGEKVTRLNSHPPLGLEHAAYRIETRRGPCWIIAGNSAKNDRAADGVGQACNLDRRAMTSPMAITSQEKLGINITELTLHTWRLS